MSEMKMVAGVNVAEVESDAELAQWYDGQSEPQPVYVELDCARNVLSASYNAEIGNAVPMSVYHGHTLRWPIPPFRAKPANDILAIIAPLASHVVAGYDTKWDGHNNVAEYNADAAAAQREIEKLCADFMAHPNESEVWTFADMGDWAGYCDAEELGVHASMTDAEVTALVSKITLDAKCENHILRGVREYVERYSREMAEEAKSVTPDQARKLITDCIRTQDEQAAWAGLGREEKNEAISAVQVADDPEAEAQAQVDMLVPPPIQYYEIYAGGKRSGEVVIETEIEPNADGIVVMTEHQYNLSFSTVGREQRNVEDYHTGYMATSLNGVVAIHRDELKFDDPRVNAALRSIAGVTVQSEKEPS